MVSQKFFVEIAVRSEFSVDNVFGKNIISAFCVGIGKTVIGFALGVCKVNGIVKGIFPVCVPGFGSDPFDPAGTQLRA